MSLTTHTLPLWFLVLSLFLPRICLIVAWVQNNVALVHAPALNSGSSFTFLSMRIPLVGFILMLLVPRILILILIYQDQGLSLWFLLHIIALLLAWGGGTHQITRRRTVIAD